MTADVFGPVEIVIDDQAINGCWTNIREVRSLSEQYLKSEAGLIIQKSASGKFTVSVVASRKNGVCSGSISLHLFNEDLGDQALYGQRSAECMETRLCNPAVNYQILKFTEALRLAGEGWDMTE